MLSNLPEWLSQSPRTRRKVMTLWRALLRVERARLAFGILVLRGKDDRVLPSPEPLAAPKLPVKELDGWVPIPTQIEVVACRAVAGGVEACSRFYRRISWSRGRHFHLHSAPSRRHANRERIVA